MSFRQIFDRIARIARAEAADGSRRRTLEDELRRAEELIEESRRPRRTTVEDASEESSPASRAGSDPQYLEALRTLGLAPGASAGEIASAYRTKARELHPDRVSHLSADEQRNALRRMQDLNLAYEYLARPR